MIASLTRTTQLFPSQGAPGSSVDTLSEQESLSSEGGDLERVDTEDVGEIEDCSVFEITDIDHQNDVLQDVMDVSTPCFSSYKPS